MTGFDERILKNPEIFKENVLPAHSDHIAYESKEQMEKGVSGLRFSLNGLWKFHYARTPKLAPAGFEDPSYDCSSWEDIRVPAAVETEGYGKPGYTNTAFPWDGHEDINPGDLPENFNPTESYVKEFILPDHLLGKPLYVSFQGVESGYALWLNGKYVGYSTDTFTPSDFELTSYLKAGINKLAVRVFRFTSGSWLEDQDFFRLSGIFRDVFLYTIPSEHLYDVKIRTLVDDDYKDAQLLVTLHLLGEEGGARICLRDNGNTIFTEEVKAKDGESIRFGEDTTCTAEQMKEGKSGNTKAIHPVSLKRTEISGKICAPKLWSAETPYLYDLFIEVLDKEGTVVEFVKQRVGFRRFEMKNGIMCINGKRIIFNGVNRHEFSADRGRTPDPEEVRADLVLMKQNNINAVRTCHYPNASILYDLCDEMGFYLIAENNMECHGEWNAYMWRGEDIEYIVPGNRKEYLELVLDRVNSCYQRDKNHAAIVIWSDGNESFSGSDLMEMTHKFHALDPDRLVHYEGMARDTRTPQVSDMYTEMYTPAATIEAFLKEHKDRPFILCEYTHSMGNSNGGMMKYTELLDREPRFQGGFIWDFVDQAFTVKNRFGENYQAYGGDFGERPTEYDFSGNGIINSLRHPYGKIQEVKFLYQTILAKVDAAAGKVKVINKNNFVNTDIYDCEVTLEKEGVLIEKKSLAVKVDPLTEKIFDLPVGKGKEDGEYVCTVSFLLKDDTFWAKKGHEVAFGQGVYTVGNGKAGVLGDSAPAATRGIPDTSFGALEGIAPEKTLKVVRGTEGIGVYGKNFQALFSLRRCKIVSYVYAGKEFVDKMPTPNFFRAPVSNDDGNFMAARQGIWKLATEYGDARLSTIPEYSRTYPGIDPMKPIVNEKEDSVSFTWKWILPTVPASAVDITYTVTADGTIDIRMDYDPVKGLPPMPQFGFKFGFDADYDHLTWYGNGPEETYWDRDLGGKLGVYSNLVADNMEEYMVPQETGNKTKVRWAKVTDRRGRGLMFKAVGGSIDGRPFGYDVDGVPVMNFSALPYTEEMLEEARHPYELPRPLNTIVNCALFQQGVGGDDSWGARTLPEYVVDSDKKISFEMSFCGI